MHIFNNIKTPEQFRLEKEMAAAKKHGMSLEEYRVHKKKEIEDERQRLHMEELKRLGLTEEEYQKRESKRIRKEKFNKYAKNVLIAISVPLVLFLMYYGIPEYLSSSEVGKDVLLVIGIILVLGLIGFYLGVPVFHIIWNFISRGEGNRLLKIVVSLIIALLIVGLLLYTCGSLGNGGSEIYEPGKLRPDKF